MTGTAPPPIHGTETPPPLEFLWDKHRKKLTALLWVIAAGLAIYYGVKYYRQSLVDKKWSDFDSKILLENGYANQDAESFGEEPIEASLYRELDKTTVAQLEDGLRTADQAQQPYFYWLIAEKAVRTRDWPRAETACADLVAKFPHHVLCTRSDYPVQVRASEKQPKDKKPKPQDEEKLKPEVAGSMVDLLRQRVEAMKAYQPPPSFTMPEIPADAPRYRIKFANRGDCVIALLPSKAPKHCEMFEQLVKDKFWDGIAIDEVQRPSQLTRRFAMTELHFGYDSTKGKENRSDWDTTKPADKSHVVEEFTGLSHFPGAVSARANSESKSEVERIWLSVDDLAHVFDGQRQVFGYVVEGLDTVKSLCEVSLSKTEEEKAGRGRPSENIRIESVTKIEK